MASISLELLINFPIAIKRTSYKIGGYAYNNKRRKLHNFQSIYITDTAARSERSSNVIDLSVHAISLNGMIDQKNPANGNSGSFIFFSCHASQWHCAAFYTVDVSTLPFQRQLPHYPPPPPPPP
jgi:hypothetical protein